MIDGENRDSTRRRTGEIARIGGRRCSVTVMDRVGRDPATRPDHEGGGRTELAPERHGDDLRVNLFRRGGEWHTPLEREQHAQGECGDR